jgi:N-acetyl-beta-hexosaminidase
MAFYKFFQMKVLPILFLFVSGLYSLSGQTVFEVNGLCVAAPAPKTVDKFISFIDTVLAPRGVNTLVLRVDFNYAYQSRPELRGENPLTESQVKKLVASCQKHGINLIPQINLLGHQSWHTKVTKLLEIYPEFDETPHVEMPEEYEWPNEDGLYCKSYCPLHPEVHEVVFDLVDEIMEVFEASDFHAGMDEVFYIANEKCPRCSGKDPAELFAGEVTRISNHLLQRNRRLWIWGDRLIDGEITGIGMWEASTNNTAPAIDMIPKSVVINDWHYERADPTPAYFGAKGFDVVACPWRNPEVAVEQVQMMNMFRLNATPVMKDHFLGVMQTIWSSAEDFMDNYYDKVPDNDERGSQVESFKAMVGAIQEIKANRL